MKKVFKTLGMKPPRDGPTATMSQLSMMSDVSYDKKQAVKQKKMAIDIVSSSPVIGSEESDDGVPCVPTTEVEMSEHPDVVEWKMWMQSHGDMYPETVNSNKNSDDSFYNSVTNNPGGDSPCCAQEYPLSPKLSSSPEDAEFRLQNWSLLDDIISHFDEYEEYKDISQLFVQDKNRPQSQQTIQSRWDTNSNTYELGRFNRQSEMSMSVSRDSLGSSILTSLREEEREEKKDKEKPIDNDLDLQAENWSLIDDIVSHFSETDTYRDISKMLIPEEESEQNLYHPDQPKQYYYYPASATTPVEGHRHKYISLMKKNDRPKRQQYNSGEGPFTVEAHRKIYTKWRKEYNWKNNENNDKKSYKPKECDVVMQSSIEECVTSSSSSSSRDDPVSHEVKDKREEVRSCRRSYKSPERMLNVNSHNDVKMLEESFANIDVIKLTSNASDDTGRHMIYDQLDSYIAQLLQNEDQKEGGCKIKITHCSV